MSAEAAGEGSTPTKRSRRKQKRANALRLALLAGDVPGLERAVQEGARVDAQLEGGRTPLTLACDRLEICCACADVLSRVCAAAPAFMAPAQGVHVWRGRRVIESCFSQCFGAAVAQWRSWRSCALWERMSTSSTSTTRALW